MQRDLYAATVSVGAFMAHRRASNTGVRQRVERMRWRERGKPWARFVVRPTLAPAPAREVSEPCS